MISTGSRAASNGGRRVTRSRRHLRRRPRHQLLPHPWTTSVPPVCLAYLKVRAALASSSRSLEKITACNSIRHWMAGPSNR